MTRQKVFAGKVLRDETTLRFIAGVEARFNSDASPVLADVEFGNIEDSAYRTLSAKQYSTEAEARSTSTH